MEFAEAIQKPRVNNVTLKRPRKRPLQGSLAVTSHHLIFSTDTNGRSPVDKPSSIGASTSADGMDNDEIWLMHKSVDLVVPELKQQSSGGFLTLKCKNFLIIALDFPSLDDCQAVARSVEILSNLPDLKLEYPFFFHPTFTILENGWTAFSTEQEFARLQIHTDFWRVSAVNKDFRVCPSYPEEVIVPRCISDEVLVASAGFRDGGRFPVLSYYHTETRSALVRCSQPLVGGANKRCKEDEQLLNAMLGPSARGYIFDTRSMSVAQNAKTKGGGTEPEMHYSRYKRAHKPITRWQSTQPSLMKLVEACNDSNISPDKWISKLNSCGWLQGVSEALTCACVAAQCLDREGRKKSDTPSSTSDDTIEMSVIVHGSEGLDSTLQVTSLVQIILDPDCRTLRGFQSLVEREWVEAGHPFGTRCAHGAYAKGRLTGPFEAPTFLGFLDCLWQIYQQFPLSFEFTEDFLVLIFEQAYASEFGTFLGNCERDKLRSEVKQKTTSLWSNVNRAEVLNKYMNPFYEPNNCAIWPSVAPQSLMLWEKLYLRWTRDWTEQNATYQTLVQWKNQEKELMAKTVKMRRQLIELEKEAQQQGLDQVLTGGSIAEETPAS